MAGALRRYRVLEFGHYIAGPLLGMLLADQGAEVVKIEPPSGDPMRRSPVFAVWNRGKKSVTLDLKREQDHKIAEALVASADVLIENFSDGAMDSLGLGYERCQQLNDKIIYVSMPGFPSEHPRYHDVKAWESALNAATGVYVDTSGEGAGPGFIEVPYASIFGAMTAAPAVTAALFHREISGEGQQVRVPLYDAMFTAMGSSLVRRHGDDWKPPLAAAAHPVLGRFYKCKDDRWVNINLGYPRALMPMLQAVGHVDWYEPITDRAHLQENDEERRLWSERFTSIWRERTSQEWERLMEDAGVPCTITRTIEEWMNTVQARESGAVVNLDDPTYGPMKQVGVQVRLSETPGEARIPAPSLGEHTANIVANLNAT